MKSLYITLLFLSANLMIAVGQTRETDSLKRLLSKTSEDTNRVVLLSQLGFTYRFTKTDSCIILTEQALNLARKLNYRKGEVRALNTIGESLQTLGDFPKALEREFEALQISKIIHDVEGEAMSLIYIGVVYVALSQYREALDYLQQGVKIYENLAVPKNLSFGLSSIGNAYEKMNILDSALFYQKKAYEISKQDTTQLHLRSMVLTRLGIVQSRLGNHNLALIYYHQVFQHTQITGDMANRSNAQYRAAELFLGLNQLDSSLYYARLAFASGRGVAQRTEFDAANLLSKLYYIKKNPDSAFHYKNIAMAKKDSLFSPQKFQQLQLLTSAEHQRQQQLQQEKDKLQNRYRLAGLISAVAIFLLIAIILWRNNRKQRHANYLLSEQKEQISQQRNNLEKALSELKSTQAQLIQSEKMASLGELTAGIAHEIQNPLNFVNNFSEVNKELLVEMKDEMNKGNIDDANAIASDIIDNEEKINHHGKRADAIVKGMLQHSRASTGKKEPTDINALADEYLRLSYHGMRAKDKSFNATLQTDFDSSIGKINVVPQDIGRVLLNLFNNAFYALTEKKKIQDENYEPIVSVSTKKVDSKIEIHVKDNGNGIPQKVVDKIFQPFFTTKPTGQGTGLGLSLSYDIVKAHGGEIRVETKEGEGAEFVIELPVKENLQ